MKIFKKNLVLFFLLIFSLQVFVSTFVQAQEPCLAKVLELTLHEAPKTHFELANKSVQDEVLSSFLTQQKSGSFAKVIDSSHVRRVGEADLTHNLQTMKKPQVTRLSEEGLQHIEELSVVTSGAGLWSRGGGSVKALVPYNIKELLGQDFEKLSLAGKIVAAKNSEGILKLAKVETVGMDASAIEVQAKIIKEGAMKTIADLLKRVTYEPKALNALDMKFINLASIQQKTGKYVSLDVWTSEQTHGAIADYIQWLQKNLTQKKFHQDPKVDQGIKDALRRYFEESDKRGDTHLFGRQEGLHAIDVKTGKYKEDTATIGKGAGAIIEYMQKSGRTKELTSRGTKTFVFENIEVVSDYPPLFASHRMAQKKVSVVLVPQKEGYVGGSPFYIQEKDKWNLQLLEMSVLPDEFAKGNEFFNTNTIFFSHDTKAPKTIGFELKDQNTIARVKQNMGDITLDNSTHGIGGRLGRDQEMVEYENFKSYDDYGDNGQFYVETFQSYWKNLLEKK